MLTGSGVGKENVFIVGTWVHFTVATLHCKFCTKASLHHSPINLILSIFLSLVSTINGNQPSKSAFFFFIVEAVLPYFLPVIVSIYLLLKKNSPNISVKSLHNSLMTPVKMVGTSNKQRYLYQSN